MRICTATLLNARRPIRPTWISAGAALVALAVFGSCSDEPVAPCSDCPPPPDAVVSNPVPRTMASTAAALRLEHAAIGDVVYVSLRPGTVPDGGLATITNTRTGASVPAAMAAGGFDPVAIEAVAGDVLAIDIELAGGATHSLSLTVPAARRPIVVRTEPPPRRRDVPLNATMLVVFSEPIDPATVGTVALLRDGAPVSSAVTLSADGLRALIAPAQPLAPNTAYRLEVPTTVRDVSGDAIEEAVTVEFTTGTTAAVASVTTPQAALFINPHTDALRAINFDAVLHDDGRVTGSYHIYYSETGAAAFGHVTCLSTDGNAAWIAGWVDSSNVVGADFEQGWRLVDHGPPGTDVHDQLSLAHPMEEGGVRSAAEWCATKPVNDPLHGPIVLHDLLSGDIAVKVEAPPPPPPPPPPPIVALVMSPDSDRVGLQVTTQLSVVARDAEGGQHPVDAAEVAWTSGNPSVAAVSSTGLVTALQPGTAVITGSWSGFQATATIAVPNMGSGEIAFGSTRDGNDDLYLVNADGSGARNLTNDPAADCCASWSPDGSMIAFTTGRDGNAEVYVMNADGSGARNLTNEPATDLGAAWSPDGTRLAFTSNRDGNRDIYTVNADGSGVTRLTDDPATAGVAGWSPDGSRIAFYRVTPDSTSLYGGTTDLYVMNPDGSSVTRLTDFRAYRPGFPQFRPDGARGAAWSPDGSRIAFVGDYRACQSCTESSLYVINADGTGLRTLTPNHAGEEVSILGGAAWAPDGTRILYAAASIYGWGINVVNPDGTELRNLAYDDYSLLGDPAWSPDGTRIAFVRTTPSGDGARIHVMFADGASITRLTGHHAGRDYAPSWRPGR